MWLDATKQGADQRGFSTPSPAHDPHLLPFFGSAGDPIMDYYCSVSPTAYLNKSALV